MKIAAVIATTGRSDSVAETLRRLARQTRAPDQVLVVGATDADFPRSQQNLEKFPGVQFVLASKGLPKQRNRALDLLGSSVDVIVFFDDDFFPAKDFIAGVERLMSEHPEVSAASGHLLADGFRSAGVSMAEADALIAAYERNGLDVSYMIDQPGAYGCNMIIRVAALPGTRCDENLPLYGWLEDLDYSARFTKVGRVVETSLCVGVHLGVKSGRSPGLQLGYSQIANPLYIAGKGSISWRRAVSMAARVIVANAIRSFTPEPYIDRRGRLAGNLRAIADLLAGRIHPMRVLDLATTPAAERQRDQSWSLGTSRLRKRPTSNARTPSA